jgi:hypothetical protein
MRKKATNFAVVKHACYEKHHATAGALHILLFCRYGLVVESNSIIFGYQQEHKRARTVGKFQHDDYQQKKAKKQEL